MCGTDAMRFALCWYTEQAQDINLDVRRVAGFRHFCNKIWNAFKFSQIAFGQNFQPNATTEVHSYTFTVIEIGGCGHAWSSKNILLYYCRIARSVNVCMYFQCDQTLQSKSVHFLIVQLSSGKINCNIAPCV